MQKLVRRMTRFFVKTDKTDTLKEVDRVFDLLGYTYKRSSPGVVSNIRILHECEVLVEKYVPRITVWHHEAPP